MVPSRVETVILFLPDVWSCVPTKLEWDGLQLSYKKQLERKLLRAASSPDDLDAANETDEAAVADQKALPTSSHITFTFLLHYIIVQLFSPITKLDFQYRLYLLIDPIVKCLFVS